MVAYKYYDDSFYDNRFYSKVGGVNITVLNELEIYFLEKINYELYVENDLFEEFY